MASLTQQQIRDQLGVQIQVNEVFTFEQAEVLWPNFGGIADKFNAEGDRNFNLRLSKKDADDLAAAGWNVKCKPARPEDEDAEERCVLKVSVKYAFKPPKITMIGSNTKQRTDITESLAGLIDAADIQTCDLSIVPYFWQMPNGNIGVSAYLKTMYVVVVEDDLDTKWAPDEPEEA